MRAKSCTLQRVQGVLLASKFPRFLSSWAPWDVLDQQIWSREAPLHRFQGSASNVLVPNTSGHVFIKTVICWNIRLPVTLQRICSLENVFKICGILLLRCRLYFQRKPVKLKIQIKLPFYLCMEIITCTLTGGNSISNPETFPLSVPGPILSTLQCKLIQVRVSWCGCTALAASFIVSLSFPGDSLHSCH